MLLHFDSSTALAGGPATDDIGGPTFGQLRQCWAERTGGRAVRLNPNGTVPGGVDLVDLVSTLIDDQAATCNRLELRAEPGNEDSLVSSTPVFLLDVALPTTRQFDIRICVPSGTLPAIHEFEVQALCAGGVMEAQRVIVEVVDACAPSIPAATVTDLSPCELGLALTWTAATVVGGSGEYAVGRSEDSVNSTRADAPSRPAVASGHAHVIEAFDTGGGACADGLARCCAEGHPALPAT